MTPKLAINAVVVLIALVAGAVVNAVSAPEWVSITGTVAAAIIAPLGARDALAHAFGLLPDAWRQEIVVIFTTGAVGITALQAAVLTPPPALTAGLAVLVALSTAIGQRSQATSLVNPKAADGTPLVKARRPSSK